MLFVRGPDLQKVEFLEIAIWKSSEIDHDLSVAHKGSRRGVRSSKTMFASNRPVLYFSYCTGRKATLLINCDARYTICTYFWLLMLLLGWAGW